MLFPTPTSIVVEALLLDMCIDGKQVPGPGTVTVLPINPSQPNRIKGGLCMEITYLKTTCRYYVTLRLQHAAAGNINAVNHRPSVALAISLSR